MKTKCLRLVSSNSISLKKVFIVAGLAVVFQLSALNSKTQTAYWLESMSNTVKKESVVAPPVLGANATILSYANIPLFIFEDEKKGEVYWSDAGTGSIRKVSTSGGSVITVLTGITGVGIYPRGIYIDVTHNMLYWAQTTPKVKDVIKKIDISGSLPKSAAAGTTVVSGIDIVRGLTVDTIANLVYFADGGKRASGKGIYRANTTISSTEATSTKVVATGAASQPNSLFIDRTNNFIYWSDYAAAGKIQRAATNAASFPTTATNVYTGASIRGMSIDLTSNEIYWTEYPALKIRKASLSNIPVINATDVVTGLSILPRNLQLTHINCTTPTGLSVSNITSTTVSLNWSPQPGAIKYIIKYRVAGTTSWLTKKTTSSPANLNNLTPSTTYTWKINTICRDDTSAYTANQTFTTASAAMAKNSAATGRLSLSSFNLYPNPVKNVLNIQGLSAGMSYELSVMSISGSVVTQTSIRNTSSYAWNVQRLVKGVYFLNIHSRDEKTIIKFVKD